MNSADPKVIHLCERDAQGALERLNRITGLRFARWPQSLAALARPVPEAGEAAEVAASLPRSADTA